MVDVLMDKLEILIASMLAMEMHKRPIDIAYVKQELQIISKLWSDIYRGYWRPQHGQK